jgi:O-antigen ligase
MPVAVERLFLRLLGALLVGYALLGKTFAGLGVPPVYVGEVVLGVGLLSVLVAGRHFRLVRTPSVYLLIAFMCWGAVRTIPYLGAYGLNALRDAVLWGYGTFALLLAPVLIRRNLVERIPALYARVFPWVILCAPAWMVVSQWTGAQGIPGTAMGAPKAGDVAVHLGGAGSFLLAGLWVRRDSVSGAKWLREWGAWLALVVGLVAMGSLTRGGLLAAISAMLTVLILLPFKAGGKLLLAGATAVLLATVWVAWGVSLPGRESRAISPEQIAQNLGSIGGGSRADLEGTRTWRILWWNSIIDYTVHGQYFWTGKGFGVNLTYDDGIVSNPDEPSRSPHNGHLTVLARTGVPGLVLWALLQLGFALSMLAGLVRARRAGQDSRAALFVWVLAYWLAFLVNASFDVYLEGPQGGIWFWCVFAYGLALIATQSRQTPWQSQAWVPWHARRVRNPSPSGSV